jgi:hypothetical protein
MANDETMTKAERRKCADVHKSFSFLRVAERSGYSASQRGFSRLRLLQATSPCSRRPACRAEAARRRVGGVLCLPRAGQRFA